MSLKKDLSNHKVQVLRTNAGCQLVAIKIGRNDLCPCGSGKKAKHCCGAGTHYRQTKPSGNESQELQ